MTDEALDAEADIKPGRSPLRTVVLVGAVLIVEAVLIVGAMRLIGGPPKVEATPEPATLDVPEDEKIVEILVFDGKLPNNKTGVAYLYQAEIYVQAKKRYANEVAEEFEQFRNEIKSEINAVWRTADPRDFQESKLQTLTRKVRAMLDERFGVDPRRGEPIITKCVIVMGTGFRVDG